MGTASIGRALVIAGACAALTVCAPYGAGEEPRPAPDASTSDLDAGADAGGDAAPPPPGDASVDGDAADGALGAPPCPPFAELCEDFETNALDATRWYGSDATGGGAQAIVSDATFGKYAFRAFAPATPGGKTALARARKSPQSMGTFALRVYLKVPKTLAYDTGVLKLRQLTASDEDMTLRATATGELRVDTDTAGSGADITSNVKVPIDQWFCLEWIVTLAQSGRHQLFIDGAPALDGAEDTVGTLEGGPYDAVELGFSFAPPDVAQEIFYDHLVLAKQRIGCSTQ